jgi:hypothetical protein
MEIAMPVCFIEAPTGLNRDAKKKLLESAGRILHETFQRDDERVFLHEHPLENTSQDGKHASEVRPVCRVEVPPIAIERRRAFAEAMNAAVRAAYWECAAADLRERLAPRERRQRRAPHRRPRRGGTTGADAWLRTHASCCIAFTRAGPSSLPSSRTSGCIAGDRA